MKRSAILGALVLACSGQGQPRGALVKTYVKECWLSKAGESYVLASVESMPLCMSIARAYNYARVAARPERTDEFGLCWEAYEFSCREAS